MMGGTAYQVDVSVKDQITAMIDTVEADIGPDRPLLLQRGHLRGRRCRGARMTTGSGSGRST